LNSSTYTSGPTLNMGTSGRFNIQSSVTVTDTAGAARVSCRISDGTTITSAGAFTVPASSSVGMISLFGTALNPAAAIKVECISTSNTSKILANQTGNSNKDSTLSIFQLQ
jgi:hypothetical protein